MIKLLIADDEPLVQIGLKSMINWEKLGIEICGVASNGNAAYELILEHHPEIVITDIQMPCSSGLELGERCKQEFGSLPVFIILTSYEDFNYAKRAISFQALDYLVKIDLSPEVLTESVTKAISVVNKLLSQSKKSPAESADSTGVLLFKERFYIRLLNNLFESRDQFIHTANELKIPFTHSAYAAAHMELLIAPNSSEDSMEKVMTLYDSSLQMLQELLGKYLPCIIIALDPKHYAVVYGLSKEDKAGWKHVITNALEQALEMLHNYYSVTVRSSIGRLVDDPMELSISYFDAKQIAGYVMSEQPILFWDELPDSPSLRNVFNMSLFRNDISKAFEELNVEALQDVFSSINTLFTSHTVPFSQALDAASSILHFTTSLLPNGMEIATSIFEDEPDTYCSLYRLKTVSDIMDWLSTLETGLCTQLPDYSRTHKHYLVENTKNYIDEHIHERIVLQSIADIFGVSPNYLSQLFKKHENIGLNEYITNQKINLSKQLLKDSSLKIYEIADQLGFESAFYFSKVFKKVTGFAPKDYRNT